MADLFKILQQAQQMQGRLQQLQEELQQQTVSGSAGGGMVTVEADGRGHIRRVKIDPSLATQPGPPARVRATHWTPYSVPTNTLSGVRKNLPAPM